MKIRRAKPEDYAVVMRLYTGLVKEERYIQPGNDSFDHVLEDPSLALFVAEEDGQVIGIASVSIRRVVRYPRPIAQLDELFVSPEARTNGTGRALVEATENFAREHDCYRLYIESHMQHAKAHTFYEHIGYSKDGYYFAKNL